MGLDSVWGLPVYLNIASIAWVVRCEELVSDAVWQMQLSRLKEQVDEEADERLSVKAEESRSQEQSRRLQRQVRELEEELADVRRKDSESSQRKQDAVSQCWLLICHYKVGALCVVTVLLCAYASYAN